MSTSRKYADLVIFLGNFRGNFLDILSELLGSVTSVQSYGNLGQFGELMANLGGNFSQFWGPFRLVKGDLMGETFAAVLGGPFVHFRGNFLPVLGKQLGKFQVSFGRPYGQL